jgi:hypothetical protein
MGWNGFVIDPWTVLRIPVRAWAAWREGELDTVPRPRDAPRAHAAGPDALEVLVVGSGAASGWGVVTHELGLVGTLCRALAHRRHGGVTVGGAVRPDMQMRHAAAELRRHPLDVYAIVCLVLGVNDVMAMTSRAEWEWELRRALDEIERRRDPGTQILVTGIQPIPSIPVFAGPFARVLDRRARQLNELTRRECDARLGVTFVELPETPGDIDNVYGDSARYAFWAEILADGVSPDTLAATPPSVQRLNPEQRADAVRRTGIAGTEPEERFDRIVRAARTVFRTSYAAFTLVDDNQQWYKSLVGPDLPLISIEHSFCYHSAQSGRPLIVPDTLRDSRFVHNKFVIEEPRVRFYAGYPVRAPSGEPVGVVCVFDSSPRDRDTIDLSSLREFALMVEAELADQPVAAVSSTPARETGWPLRRR